LYLSSSSGVESAGFSAGFFNSNPSCGGRIGGTGAPGFGSDAQSLHPFSGLQEGLVNLS